MNIEDINVDKELRIVFMGTPDFAVPVLQGLIDNYNVKAVVTQPDKPVGRHGEISMSPIKKLALDNTILVLQPKNLKEEWQDVMSLHPDMIVTCAYGQIVPRELLVYPKYGCINVHASLLPKLRGGAPIHRAIIEGYRETGVTIMHMNAGLDTGDIITQRPILIDDSDTAETLHDKLSVLGRDLLLDTMPSIIDGTAPSIPQDDSISTFASNIKPEDEKIDFSKTKRQIYNQVRGLNSWPGAYFNLMGKRIKVYECIMSDNNLSNLIDGQISGLYPEGIGIKVSNGEVILTKIKPEGKGIMKASDYINGIQDKNSLIGKICE
ncbi:MAG: methionyl-tRNA formyltransferase [Bacilli bacterium]|nr:methionyl-tRNA formyltransferase [Bacilli bacterium]